MKIMKSMLPLAGISRSGVSLREYLRAKLQARLAAKRRAPDAFMTIAEASSREVDEVLAALDTSREGLTEAEAEARLDRYGFNEVAHERPPRWYAQLPLAFKNPILLSKRRRNDGPTKIRLIVTNLGVKSASEMLNLYARRWMVEVTFKELKSGLQLGRMQVTKDPKRVRRAVLLPVMAYLLLVRLYAKELDPDQGVTIFQLKQRFSEEVWQEQLDRSEARWRKKLDQLRAAA
jgi:hypothetical protein